MTEVYNLEGKLIEQDPEKNPFETGIVEIRKEYRQIQLKELMNNPEYNDLPYLIVTIIPDQRNKSLALTISKYNSKKRKSLKGLEKYISNQIPSARIVSSEEEDTNFDSYLTGLVNYKKLQQRERKILENDSE